MKLEINYTIESSRRSCEEGFVCLFVCLWNLFNVGISYNVASLKPKVKQRVPRKNEKFTNKRKILNEAFTMTEKHKIRNATVSLTKAKYETKWKR